MVPAWLAPRHFSLSEGLWIASPDLICMWSGLPLSPFVCFNQQGRGGGDQIRNQQEKLLWLLVLQLQGCRKQDRSPGYNLGALVGYMISPPAHFQVKLVSAATIIFFILKGSFVSVSALHMTHLIYAFLPC